MVDQDTDRWIFEVLAPHLRRKLETLEPEVQWTDLMYVGFSVRSFISTPAVLSYWLSFMPWVQHGKK